QEYLKLPNLLSQYQSDLAVALAENNFPSWQLGILKKDLNKLQLSVMKWLYQAYEFFQSERPEDLKIPFPEVPNLDLPPKPKNTNNNDLRETGSIAVGSGVGWLLGGPVGAAVVGSISYLLSKNLPKNGEQPQDVYHQQVAKLCITAAEKYLSDLSTQGLYFLAEYERKADKVINFQPELEPQEIKQKREDFHNLQILFNQLCQDI
ncbi:MAG: dynamin family protein, partial [Sphaerospermopsis sp. SIO1G2]|nr:dynamin family protein [Sphaerospermopsis sp. SIO1G2]